MSQVGSLKPFVTQDDNSCVTKQAVPRLSRDISLTMEW